MRLLSGRRLFVRLRRGSPSAVPEDPVAYTADQVVWLVPDTDSDATRAVFSRVLADNRRRWLLASLSGRRQHQFLGGYAERHTYMTVHNGTTRFYGADDFHRRRRERGRCRGGRYRQRPRRAGVHLNRRAMEDVHLKVLYTDADKKLGSDKMQTLHRDGVITGGFTGTVILLLKEVLGFNYSLHPVEATGNLSAWDHAVQLLHQGHGDMFGGRMLVTASRSALVDFSIPIITDLAGAAIDSRYTLALTEFQITQPLESPVWYALLATQLLAVLVLCLIARCQQHIRQASGEPPDPADPSFWALVVLGVSCQQGAAVRSDAAHSYRLAISALYVLSLFIFACYSGNLLAEMTVERPQMPFDSVSEALNSGWRVSREGMSQAMHDVVARPLLGRPLSASEMTPAGPLDGKNMLLLTGAFTSHKYNCTADRLAEPDGCPVCMWPTVVRRHRYSLACRRRFPYLRLVNYVLPRLLDLGLLSRQLGRWMPQPTGNILCPRDTVRLKNTRLGTDNLKYMFAIVIAGLVGSIVVLVLERIFFALWMFYIKWKHNTEMAMFADTTKAMKVISS